MSQRRRDHILSKQSYVLSEPTAGLPWVLRVAMEHWDKTFVNPRPAREAAIISYIQEGQMRVQSGLSSLRAGPGSVMYLARENAIQEVRVASEEGLRLILLVVREGSDSDVVTSCLGTRSRCLTLSDCSSVESLFYLMLNAATKSYPAASDIVARLLQPTLETIREEHRHASTVGDSRQMLFNGCRGFITHRYLEIESVSAVAKRFGISHAWLCRLFKEYSDTTPHRFLLQRKMTYALHELQQHDRSVGSVATELGFADPYSFSKAFKRVMGYTPSAAKPAAEER